MKFPTAPIENIWDSLLSSDPDRIRAIYDSLDPAEQESVLTHLRRMVKENGWQPVQQIAAQAAIDTLISGEKGLARPME